MRKTAIAVDEAASQKSDGVHAGSLAMVARPIDPVPRRRRVSHYRVL